jgi:hypothetical protein
VCSVELGRWLVLAGDPCACLCLPAGVVSTARDVERYIRCTLLAATQDFQGVVAKSTMAALAWLCKQEFIRWAVEFIWLAASPGWCQPPPAATQAA